MNKFVMDISFRLEKPVDRGFDIRTNFDPVGSGMFHFRLCFDHPRRPKSIHFLKKLGFHNLDEKSKLNYFNILQRIKALRNKIFAATEIYFYSRNLIYFTLH